MPTRSLTFLSVLLFGASSAFADVCEVPPCEPVCDVAPCDEVACNPCDPCGSGAAGSGRTLSFGRTLSLEFGGWVEAGIYTNGNGGGDNGPMHTESNRRTDFLMNQLYFFGEKKMDSEHRLDWGARADLVYGVDGPGMRSWSDGTFDGSWDTNDDGYGLAMYQLYATLGYKKLSVKYGKFITPIGWEASASKDNFFYSHSYNYWIEPSTHVGALADYALHDRLTLSAGWTAGHDVGFGNRFNDSAILIGLTGKLSDKATIYYLMNKGNEQNGDDDSRFGPTIARNEFFIQSICLEWLPTDRFTYMLQYNLRNDNLVQLGGTPVSRTSAYGINNHFRYNFTDKWSGGIRAEWLRDNGDLVYINDGGAETYWGLTFGLKWDPCEQFSIRPEVRLDWCTDSPFANETKANQVTGGFGMLYKF